MRRGQAALEFLSTYGFAFLALLITLGAISYLNVFNVGSIRSNECSMPSGMECLDFIFDNEDPGVDLGTLNPIPLTGAAPYVRMVMYNSYGVNLTIVNTTITMEVFQPGTNESCAIVPAADGITWPLGTNKTFWCPVNSGLYHPGAFYSGTIDMQFMQQGGSYVHNTKGILLVTAQ